MALNDEIMNDKSVQNQANLVRWLVICTIAVCSAFYGWAYNLREVIATNNTMIQVLTKSVDNAEKRLDRLEHQMDAQ